MSYNAPLPPPCIKVSISNTLPVIGIDNQYTCTLSITPQNIQGGGSQYDVSTIAPGFWVSNYPFGEAWKIIQISNINVGSQTMDAVIEDVEYYNYSIDPDTGEHGPNDGAAGYCWTLADDGLPNLFPVDPTFLTSTANYTYVTDLINRFRSRNYYTSYVQAYQNGSTFQTGQFLILTSTGSFQVSTSNSSTVYDTIGVVTSSGYPTSGYFTYRPFGQFLTYDRITPPLTAGVGSVYYINSTGGISTNPGSNSYPIYIQVSTGPTGGNGILLSGRFGQTSGGSGTGPQGFQGLVGETGPQGFQGLVGHTGADGPQGLIGHTGTIGYQGFQGIAGQNGLSSGLVLYMNYPNLSNEAGSLYDLSTNPTGGSTQNQTTTINGIIGTGPLLPEFLSLPNINNSQLFIAPGLWDITLFASTPDTINTVSIYAQVGIFSTGGSTTTLATTNSKFINNTIDDYTLTANIPYTNITLDDRVVVNLFGQTTNSSGSNITTYYLDSTYSHILTTLFETIPTGPAGPQGFQGLIGETGTQGFQGLIGETGPQGFQGYVGPTGVVDFSTGSFDNLFVNNLTIGTQIIMETGAYLASVQDTFYVDANLNVSNIFTVNSVTSEVEFGNFVGGDIVPNITINGVNGTIYCTGSTGAGYFNYLYVDFLTGPNLNIGGGSTGSQGPQGLMGPTGTIDFSTGVFDNLYVENLTIGTQIIMETGSYITGQGQTVFIDGHLNVSNIFTVDATSGEVQYGLEPTITMNGVNGTIYCTGSTGAGYFNYLYVDFLTGPNLNFGSNSTGPQGFQGLMGPTGVVDFSTGSFDNLFVNNLTIGTQIMMETGSYIAGEGQTVFIDGHLNVSNVFTVDAITGVSSFNNYTGGQLIPAVEIDPVAGKIILQTGSYITGEGQTVFIDGNMNISNIFTVNATNSNVEFGNYIGGVLYPNITVNGVSGSIYCTGSTGIGYFNTINTKNLQTSFSVYTGATGSSSTMRGRIYCSTGNQLFMNNSLATTNSSIFTNLSSFTTLTIPSIAASVCSNGYFTIYLGSNIETSPGQTISIDWFLTN